MPCMLLCFLSEHRLLLIFPPTHLGKHGFIHRRFSAYHNIKTDHEQWDKLGKDLWEHFVNTHKEEERFLHAVQEAFHHSDTNG